MLGADAKGANRDAWALEDGSEGVTHALIWEATAKIIAADAIQKFMFGRNFLLIQSGWNGGW